MRKLKLDELGRLSPDEYKQSEKKKVIVILDNIRSALNVGSVFRSCDAFSIETLYLCGITAAPPNKEINKTALGSTETVNWKHVPSTLEAVKDLKEKGYKIYSVEQAAHSVMLNKCDGLIDDCPTVLILGNEVDGVAQDVINISDACIEIPQTGTKHSLNVAVAAGIVLWKFCGI